MVGDKHERLIGATLEGLAEDHILFLVRSDASKKLKYMSEFIFKKFFDYCAKKIMPL